eukprot:Opistho-2@68840
MPSESAYVSVLASHGLTASPMDYADLLEPSGSSGRIHSRKRTPKAGGDGGEDEHAQGKKEFKLSHDAEAAATAIQLEAERLILSDKTMTTLARKAFQSFVRGYATYPTPMKSVGFIVSALHLGHAAKSFALREAPRELQRKSQSNNAKGRVSKATAKAQLVDRQKERRQETRHAMRHSGEDGNLSYRRGGSGGGSGGAGSGSGGGGGGGQTNRKRKMADEFGNDLVDGPLTKKRKTGGKGKK